MTQIFLDICLSKSYYSSKDEQTALTPFPLMDKSWGEGENNVTRGQFERNRSAAEVRREDNGAVPVVH